MFAFKGKENKKKASGTGQWKGAEFDTVCVTFVVAESVGSTERRRGSRGVPETAERASDKRGTWRSRGRDARGEEPTVLKQARSLRSVSASHSMEAVATLGTREFLG